MSAVGAAQYVAKSIDNIIGLDDDLVWRNSEVYSMLRDIQEELASEVQSAAGVTLTPEEANRAWDWAMRLQEESDGLTPEDQALADKLRVAL